MVSVIMPAYNYGHLLPQALRSLQAQTLRDWECLVVDDGSTDDTAEVARAFAARDPRVRCLRQDNRGPGAARNTGLGAARGEWVQFLDADDLLAPRKLELQAAFLAGHPGTGIVYGGMRYFDSTAPEVLHHSMSGPDRPWMPEVSGAGHEVLPTLLYQNIMVINAPLVRREVIDRVGPFDEVLRGVEDWHYWIRCAVLGVRFAYLDLPGALALVRLHPGSLSRDRLHMLHDKLRLRRGLATVLDRAARRRNRRLLAEDCGLMAVEQVRRGAYREGLRHLGYSAWHARGRLVPAWWGVRALRAWRQR